jgi:hypothetical protein
MPKVGTLDPEKVTMTRSRLLTAVAVAVTAATSCTALAGCTTSSGRAVSHDTHSAAALSVSSSTPAHRWSGKPAEVDPLTGDKPSNNPVIAVRIDDTAAGRPQAGVTAADIVYVTQVEGGLIRLLAIFHTTLPTAVEPVRSTRADNPQLALEYGHIDYVASGGSHPELAPLNRSPLRSDINDRGGPGFSRDPRRIAPENLIADLPVIAKKLHGPTARSIGLTWNSRFDAKSSGPGRAVRTTVGATPVDFVWKPDLHRYVRMIDGRLQRAASGALIATPNVIVQFCKVTVYWKDKDVDHNPAAWTHTIGQGRAVVFRNGRKIVGTWTRRDVNSGTVLRAHGRSIPLTPGGAWFVLVRTGTALH